MAGACLVWPNTGDVPGAVSKRQTYAELQQLSQERVLLGQISKFSPQECWVSCDILLPLLWFLGGNANLICGTAYQ